MKLKRNSVVLRSSVNVALKQSAMMILDSKHGNSGRTSRTADGSAGRQTYENGYYPHVIHMPSKIVLLSTGHR